MLRHQAASHRGSYLVTVASHALRAPSGNALSSASSLKVTGGGDRRVQARGTGWGCSAT